MNKRPCRVFGTPVPCSQWNFTISADYFFKMKYIKVSIKGQVLNVTSVKISRCGKMSIGRLLTHKQSHSFTHTYTHPYSHRGPKCNWTGLKAAPLENKTQLDTCLGMLVSRIILTIPTGIFQRPCRITMPTEGFYSVSAPEIWTLASAQEVDCHKEICCNTPLPRYPPPSPTHLIQVLMYH